MPSPGPRQGDSRGSTSSSSFRASSSRGSSSKRCGRGISASSTSTGGAFGASSRRSFWFSPRPSWPSCLPPVAPPRVVWSLLLPDEYRLLGKHALAGAGFLSNIALWREAGYFAPAAEVTPLLHLWSLGVEEQYYLVWPLALAFFAARPRALPWMIVGLAAVSFALNVWLTPRAPSAAFYLPLTRFWELMAGSALAYHAPYGTPGRRMADAQAAAGPALGAAGLALPPRAG